MSHFRFSNKEVQKAFRKVMSMHGDSKKIDHADEEKALESIFEKYKNDMTESDIALFKSQALKFDNRKIKRAYKEIARMSNSDREINTEAEIEAAESFLNENRHNMSDNDKSLFENLLETSKQNSDENNSIYVNIEDVNAEAVKVIIDPDGESIKKEVSVDEKGIAREIVTYTDENGNATILIPEEDLKPDNAAEKLSEDDNSTVVQPEDEQGVSKENCPETLEENREVSNVPPPKKYQIKGGDYWYKMVYENYNVSTNAEVMAIVRKFKDDYFEEHRNELTKKGHNSSKSGFFIPVGTIVELPQSLSVGGKTYTLK